MEYVTRSELVAALEAAAEEAQSRYTAGAFRSVADALRRPANPLDDENANLRHSLGFAEAAHALASKHRDEAIAERDALRARLEEGMDGQQDAYVKGCDAGVEWARMKIGDALAALAKEVRENAAPTAPPAPAEASEDAERDTLISRVLDRWDNCQPIADAMNALSRYERARRGEGK